MFLSNVWLGRLETIPVLVFARAAIYGFGPRRPDRAVTAPVRPAVSPASTTA
jgi:hypothetical protein